MANAELCSRFATGPQRITHGLLACNLATFAEGQVLMPIGPADRGLLILTSLAEGPKHGYALMQDIEAFAGVSLGPGTLYGALSRLEAEGLIEALGKDERRLPYRITAAGSRALSEELAQSARITGVGLSRLAAAGG